MFFVLVLFLIMLVKMGKFCCTVNTLSVMAKFSLRKQVFLSGLMNSSYRVSCQRFITKGGIEAY